MNLAGMTESGEQRSDESTDPAIAETLLAKPADVDFEEFYRLGKRLGLKKETVDLALLIGKKPRTMLGARQILMHEQDFLRAYEFMASYQFGRGNLDGAYDAQLGLINQIASLSHYNPAFRLDAADVETANSLRQDIGFLQEVDLAVRTRTLTWPLVHAVEDFYQAKGHDQDISHYTVLLELRREFRRKIDELMVKVKIAIFPLASSRRNQQTGEPGREQDPSQSEPSVDVGSLALGAVAGTRPPAESKPE